MLVLCLLKILFVSSIKEKKTHIPFFCFFSKFEYMCYAHCTISCHMLTCHSTLSRQLRVKEKDFRSKPDREQLIEQFTYLRRCHHLGRVLRSVKDALAVIRICTGPFHVLRLRRWPHTTPRLAVVSERGRKRLFR